MASKNEGYLSVKWGTLDLIAHIVISKKKKKGKIECHTEVQYHNMVTSQNTGSSVPHLGWLARIHEVQYHKQGNLPESRTYKYRIKKILLK